MGRGSPAVPAHVGLFAAGAIGKQTGRLLIDLLANWSLMQIVGGKSMRGPLLGFSAA